MPRPRALSAQGPLSGWGGAQPSSSASFTKMIVHAPAAVCQGKGGFFRPFSPPAQTGGPKSVKSPSFLAPALEKWGQIAYTGSVWKS
ncbi:hypothetical protein HMPREF0262_02340 [Clostridium sp. ATCC 29733]|nr:hypothetical protein HMPREF0262_02340 [Clostridium sp. ATCC 29733]